MTSVSVTAMGPSASHPALAADNITLAGRGAKLSAGLLAVGALGLAVTSVSGVLLGRESQALASYLVGTMLVTGLSLGGLFFTMFSHLVAAGWSATIRRQFEHLMCMLPVCMVLLAVFVGFEVTSGGILVSWLKPHVSGIGTEHPEHLYGLKAAYLSVPFALARLAVYFGIWWVLARLLWGYSSRQDRTGDRFLSNKARWQSSWGMLAFGFSLAFFSFDWLMAVADYRFFSTMWGVYFFAGAMYGTIPTAVLVLLVLRRAGKLAHGAVTDEHLHDLGKLMFAFTVFWAYIAFSQYFLIWYSNIPEETAFYLARKQGDWAALTALLAVGHFALPFYILLWKWPRKRGPGLAVMAVYMLVMHVADLFWIIRPIVGQGLPAGQEAPPLMPGLWLDAAGVIGVAGLWAGLLVRRIGSSPLIPVNDPRLPEALKHKIYV